MSFDPKEHIIKIQGRDYLETRWREVWFRDKNPEGSITTEVIQVGEVFAVRATVSANGNILATGMASIRSGERQVWKDRDIEKAETAAIGRALAHAGFGTQFTDEDDTDYLADSPNGKPEPAQTPQRSADAWNMTELVSATKHLYANDFEQMNSLKKHTGGDAPLIGNITTGAAVELLTRYKTKQQFDNHEADISKEGLDKFIVDALDKSLSDWRKDGKSMADAWSIIQEALALRFPADDEDIPF